MKETLLDELKKRLHDLSISCETNYQSETCDLALTIVEAFAKLKQMTPEPPMPVDDGGIEDVISASVTDRHNEITRLQSQHDRLVRELEKVSASWQRHGPRIIESRGGLGDNRVCEVNDAIEAAQALLTEIKKGR